MVGRFIAIPGLAIPVIDCASNVEEFLNKL